MYSTTQLDSKKKNSLGVAPIIATTGIQVGTSLLKSIFGGGKNNDFGLPNDVWEQHLIRDGFYRFTWSALGSFKNKPETAGELPQGWTTADLYFNQFFTNKNDVDKLIRFVSPGGNKLTADGRFLYYNRSGQQLWSDNQVTQPEFLAAINKAYGVPSAVASASAYISNNQTVASTASFLTTGATPYILGGAALLFFIVKGK